MCVLDNVTWAWWNTKGPFEVTLEEKENTDDSYYLNRMKQILILKLCEKCFKKIHQHEIHASYKRWIMESQMILNQLEQLVIDLTLNTIMGDN